jgi:TIR domain/NACHT domain
VNEQGVRNNPLTLFYSYTHEDEMLCQELDRHLRLLQRRGIISAWYDRKIVPGTDWSKDIDYHLNQASVILLLVSSDFLASDYCYQVEMQRALERHQSGEARVIPILLRPVDWHEAPFAHLQSLPRNAQPVTLWDNQDAAFRDIAEGIRTTVEDLDGLSPRKHTNLGRQNRKRLLKRMRDFWISGVLEHSLHHEVLITLGLQEQPDAVANPWRLTIQESNLPPHPLPAGIHITQVYDDADGELLILGEPGAGKTTLLLDLARDLLVRAEKHETHPIPVLFNLSSWAEKRQSLTLWLVEELYMKYQIPHKVGQMWIETDQIVLLLDGLDEVASAARSTCIDMINAYRQEHDLASVVVCSRSAEYLAQAMQMLLHRAVIVQPLTMQQINEYLSIAGEKLEGVRVILHEDKELQELATTPLMLSVLAMAYQGKAAAEVVTTGTTGTQRQQIFEAYVKRMLKHRGVPRYTQKQTKYWLSWLGQQMLHHDLTGFSKRQITPDWLPSHQTQQLYHSVTRGLHFAFIGLVGLVIGSIVGLAFGHLAGLIAGLIDVGATGFVASLQNPRMLEPFDFPSDADFDNFRNLPSGQLSDAPPDTRHPMRFIGLIPAGIMFGIVMVGVMTMVTETVPIFVIAAGLIIGLVGGVISGLVGLLVGGIRTGLNIGLSVWLAVGLFSVSLNMYQHIQRFVLPVLLWRSGYIPWNYHHFLDYATERILLRRTGREYIFIHRLLLEYFAARPAELIFDEETE